MNWLRAMLGYYTGKGLAWKWSEPLGRRGQSSFYTHLPAYEDETNRVFRNVSI